VKSFVCLVPSWFNFFGAAGEMFVTGADTWFARRERGGQEPTLRIRMPFANHHFFICVPPCPSMVSNLLLNQAQ
jgi:hypothetical protein